MTTGGNDAERAVERVEALCADVQERWERRGGGQRLVPLSLLRAALDGPDQMAPNPHAIEWDQGVDVT